MGKRDIETENKKKKKRKRSKDTISMDSTAQPVSPLVPSEGTSEVAALSKPSSFKALNTTLDQTVTSNYPVKMQFSAKQFDLAHEYNAETSTFIPAVDGIYLVLANLIFNPFDLNGDYRTRIEIRVNGMQAAAMEHDFFGGDSRNMAAISTILKLQGGDQVEIFAKSNISGTFFASENDTRFEAVRFPS